MDRVRTYTIRLMALFTAALFALVIVAAVVINSGMFNRVAKNRIESMFNEEYRGRLQLREVHLNFPDRVTLVAPGIFEENVAEPAISASKIGLRFNFLSLLKPRLTTLSFNDLSVDGLRGRILMEQDGRLNLQKVFTERDPNKPKTIDIQNVRCRRLSLTNASLLYAPLNAPQYDVRSLDLVMSKLLVGKNDLIGSVDRLRFSMPDRGFTLRKGSGMIAFSKKGSEVIGLDLETDKSRAQLSVSVDGLDLFSGVSLQRIAKSPVFVHLESIKLHTDDINRLHAIPALPVGLYTLKGDGRGNLGDLKILPAVLEHGDSRVAFQGEILNVQDPKNLSFSMHFDKSKISAGLLEQIAGKENLKKLAKESGGMEFSGLLQGKTEQWLADLTFGTKLGTGKVSVDARKLAESRYFANGTFAVEKAVPHLLLGIDKATSGFSGSGSFNATFTKAAALESGHLEAAVTSAFWQQQRISSGTFAIDFTGSTLSTTADLHHTDGSALSMTGTLDLNPQNPSYQASGSMARLDLSKVSGSNEFTTDLNGTFEVKGQGFDPATLNLSANMVFSPSMVNDFQIRDHSTVSAGIVQSPASTAVTLSSNFMDVSLQGNASLSQILSSVRLVSSCVEKELGEATTLPIASKSRPGRMVFAGLPDKPFTVDYKITIRDITPLGPLLQTRLFRFQGNAAGKVSWTGSQLAVNSDIGIGRLESSGVLQLDNATLKASMQCGPAGLASASLTGVSATAMVAGKEMKSVQVNANYVDNSLNASLDLAVPANQEKFSTVIQTRRNGSLTTVWIRKFTLTSPNGVWQTKPDETIDVASTYIRFNRVSIAKGAQSIVFDGVLSSSQPGTFQCDLTNIELDELNQFLPDQNLGQLSGRANARISVSGRPGAKTSTMDLRGNSVAFDDIRIGSLHLTADHSGDRMRFDLESHNPPPPAGSPAQKSVNTIRGSGTVPLILSFSPFRLEFPERHPVDISLHSDDLSAKFLIYAVPLVQDAEGVIPTDLRITGSFPKPDIILKSRMEGTMVRITPTEVSYVLNGQINGTPSKLDISGLSVRDNLQGTGTLSGIVTLDGLKPKSVDLSGTCRNLLIYNKKDKKDDTSFGTIQGSTNSFRFFGDLAAPTAEGEFRVTAADFNIYRKGSNESAKYIGVEKFIEFVPRYPSATPHVASSRATEEYSTEFHQDLLDILQISNLKLSCNVPLRFSMIFDRIRGERLETSINNLSLNVSKTRQRFNLFGSVDIFGGKYNFSNSYFDIESGGRVVWNNEEIRDGALKNLYGTKLVSASDSQTGERDNVKLLLAIGGTINEPNVRMGYYLNDDLTPYASSNTIGNQTSHIDPNADLNVISMLLSRQWYLNPERQGRTGNLPVSTVGMSAGTGMLSSQFSGLVQGLAGLESFNVNVGTSNNGALKGVELYFALLVPGTGGKVRFIGTGNTPTGGTGNNYYGSSQKIEYRINPKVYVQAFRSYGQNGSESATTNLQTPTQNWGASVSYRERFHTWGQFWNHLIGRKEKRAQKGAAPAPPASTPAPAPAPAPLSIPFSPRTKATDK